LLFGLEGGRVDGKIAPDERVTVISRALDSLELSWTRLLRQQIE